MARLAFAVAASLLVAAGVRAAEEPTYTACKTSNDCVSDDNVALGQTSCMIYSQYQWTDTTKTPNVDHNVQFGICVQCQSDCDCGVNEYCAAGPKISSKWWGADDETNAPTGWVQNALEQYNAYRDGNYKFLGQCLEYGASDAEADIVGAACNPGLSVSAASSNDPDHADNKMACGYVSDWQPEYRECNAIVNHDGTSGTACATGDDRVKNAGFNKPGTCTAKINNANVANTPTCSADGTFWSGACVNKECQICAERATRCGGNDEGIPQICIGGKWVPRIFFDDTPRTASGSVVVQAEAAMVAFMSVMVVISCFSCMATARAAKNMQGAAKE